jgi:hypothetical protein
MAFDAGLVERIREVLEDERGIVEKKMFGGIAFLSPDHMFVGLAGTALMARVGPVAHERALSEPHVRPMDFTGRPMKGYVFVDPPGIDNDEDLRRWVLDCLAFVRTLPPKKPKKPRLPP